MGVRLRQVSLAATAVVCVAFALPAIASASGGSKCNASACKVYIEPNSQGTGKSPSQQSTGSHTGGGGQSQQQSKGMARVLLLAGSDRVPLSRLLHDSGISSLQGGQGNVAGPSLLGAALDLGPGPLALLAILVATALAVAAMRHRQRGRPNA